MLSMDQEKIVFSLSELMSRVEPRVQRMLTEVSFSECGIRDEDAPHQALQCLTALEGKAAESDRTVLKQRIRELEHQGKFEDALLLAGELNRLEKPTSNL